VLRLSSKNDDFLADQYAYEHFGENIFEHAKRELLEKTALSIPLEYRGIANIQINLNSHILTHVVAHIHFGLIEKIVLPLETTKYQYKLINFSNLNQNFMPGTIEIYNTLNKNSDNGFILNIKQIIT